MFNENRLCTLVSRLLNVGENCDITSQTIFFVTLSEDRILTPSRIRLGGVRH